MKLLADMVKQQNAQTTLMKDYPDYTLDYLSFVYLDGGHADNICRFADYVALHHEGRFDAPKIMSIIRSGQMGDKTDFYKMTAGFWVLRHNGDLVCVATMYEGFKLNYITTMVEQRRKGYATFLLSRLREFYAHYGFIYGAIYPALLPLFERSGWNRPNDKDNKDGTIDVCPDYAQDAYTVHLPTVAYREKMTDEAKSLPLLSATKSAMGLVNVF
jgi:GNAT superfamily N-acetyltransferase